MSMNLTCNLFDPDQTPSYITELILDYQENGKPCGGHEAVARRYITWLRYMQQSVGNATASDPSYQGYINKEYDKKIMRVNAVMSSGTTIEFGMG